MFISCFFLHLFFCIIHIWSAISAFYLTLTSIPRRITLTEQKNKKENIFVETEVIA